MFNFKELEHRYKTDAAFNKMVNCFDQLISQHGFTPSEMREGLFYAQYVFEMNNARQVIRTQEDWKQLEEAREILKTKFTGFDWSKE